MVLAGAGFAPVAIVPAALAAEEPPKSGGSNVNYVRLKPITFSVIGPDDRITAQVGVLLQLQMAPGKSEADLTNFRRQIEDRFLVELTELWDRRGPDDPPVSAETIKSRLLATATKIAGPHLIDAVLIQELSERAR